MKIEINTNMTPKTKKILQVAVASILTIGVAIGTVKASIDARFVNESVAVVKTDFVNELFSTMNVNFYQCGSEIAFSVQGQLDSKNPHRYLLVYKDGKSVPVAMVTKSGPDFKQVIKLPVTPDGYVVTAQNNKLSLNGVECRDGLNSSRESRNTLQSLKGLISDKALNEASRERYKLLSNYYGD